jgi:fatty-acyl-CoA synthase
MAANMAGRVVSRRSIASADEISAIEARAPLDHLPGDTIHAVLRHAAARWPTRAAIVQLASPDDHDPFTITFADYLTQVEHAAALFQAAAGGERPVVAILAPFLPEAFVAAWGAAVGGVYVPINPFLEVDHVAGILRASAASVLVAATDAAGPGAWSNLDQIIAAVPSLRAVYRIGDHGRGDDDLTSAAERQAMIDARFATAASADEDCAFLHTGGTTATPKLVRHTHAGQLIQGWLCGTVMGAEEDGVVAHAMPNFHVGGAIAVGARGLIFGQTVVTMTSSGFRNPGIVPAFWDIVERFGITSITTAPTTATAILDAGGDGPRTLRQFTTGGGPLPPALARAFHTRHGLHAREVWGGTEFHGILSFHYGGAIPPRLGSCGVAVPYHSVMSAILDGQRFVRAARADERGILIAHGPTTIAGYVDPTNDATFFVEGGPGGYRWASTGDVGAVDADGYIWIFGREKDVIIRGGHNIDSALIDDVLASHPAVLHAAAVGRPCPAKGELPVAYVQLCPGASVTADDLLAYARAHIQERAAVPSEILILDAMPMTAVGKVSKPLLRLDAIRRVAEAIAATCGTAARITVEERGGRAVVILTGIAASDLTVLAAAFDPFVFLTELRS